MNIARGNRKAGGRAAVRRAALVAVLGTVALTLGACTDVFGGGRDIDIIWPRHGSVLYDEETLRARVRGYDLEDYDIYWYVDDSRAFRMWDEWYENPPHKADIVDTWYWDWRGRGPYTVGFIAEDRSGRQIARRTVRVYVE